MDNITVGELADFLNAFVLLHGRDHPVCDHQGNNLLEVSAQFFTTRTCVELQFDQESE
jgi:hypothetical protein